MINAKCQCGGELVVGEDAVNNVYACPNCGRALRTVCAEQLADGAGAGDFDGRLAIVAGPSRVGEIIFLGGVMEIEVGKLPGKHLLLEANMVSRFHCKLVRVDFGPSRWKIVDNKSTNGLFVNRQRVAEHELQNGDQINIGGYQLEYSVAGPTAAEEEPIDLGAMEEAEGIEEAEAVTIAAPPKVKKKKPKAPKVPYARPSTRTGGTGEVRLLNDSDPDWVKKIQLASNLLVLAIIINFLSNVSDKFANEMVGFALGGVSALCNLLGAWFLTEGEPDAEESSSNAVLRNALRIVAIISSGGALSMVAGLFMEHTMMIIGGLIAYAAAAIPLFFLLLLYIRVLALRIPNDSLATHCMIVMIGLPATIAIIGGSVVIMGRGAIMGMGMVTVCGGVCAIVGFAIWYLAILIWFQKSLN
ncbi:MAG TPA: FHA domain-containing protein [Tepidisphaeraceae bacterium]|jgi:pSer/pThr/pTyr-binding forkhead associated (FHA) protein|nr:FHA domain-containing protein [Tepidisphaeraceae bacterium]